MTRASADARQSPANGETSALRHASLGWETAALIACGLFYVAFNFSAWDWPSIDGYPAIERYLDPSFLKNDFYVSTTARYGVDTIQAVILGSIQQLTGVSYEISLAVLNFLRCLFLPLVLFYFFRVFTNDRQTAFVGVVIGTMASFSLPRTLGWAWLWGDASPAMFAVFAVMAAWALFLSRKVVPAFLLFALASLLQPLVAVHGTVFLILAFFLDYTAHERWQALAKPKNLVSGAVFAASLLSQYVLLSPASSEKLSTGEYTQIIAFDRHPGDFIPSLFPADIWFAFSLAGVAVAILLAWQWRDLPRRGLVMGTLAAYLAFCVAGYFFVELWPVRFFVTLIPYRTVILAAPFMLLVTAVFAQRELRAGRYLDFALIAGVFALASPVATHFGITRPFLPAAVLLLVVLARTTFWSGAFPPVDRLLAYVLVPRSLAVAVVVLGVAGAIEGLRWRPDAFVIPNEQNQHPVYQWADEKAPPEAVFLVEQYSSDGNYATAISPQKMRLIGQRAVVASMDFPFRDRDMRYWHERWLVALGGGTYDFIEHASGARLAQINAAFRYDYVIRQTPLPEGSGLTLEKTFAPSSGIGPLFVYAAPNVRAMFETSKAAGLKPD